MSSDPSLYCLILRVICIFHHTTLSYYMSLTSLPVSMFILILLMEATAEICLVFNKLKQAKVTCLHGIFLFNNVSYTDPVCEDVDPDCDTYGVDYICTEDFKPWASIHCAKFCDLCEHNGIV